MTPLEKLREEKLQLTYIDLAMYGMLFLPQINELIDFIEKSKPSLKDMLEVSFEEPNYYNKDMFLAYKKFREDILKVEMKLLSEQFNF